ncbi:MAG: hypothetical protein JJE50_04370 [Actinomycetales bacterium]|nr:hypothetical protein [Actinomycetales bacterium]
MARTKRKHLPPALSAHLPSADRPLVAEPLDDGAWAVLARGALSVVAEDGVRWRRPWHEVDRGEWDDEQHTMTLTWVDGSPATILILTNDAPREFPSTIRELVQSSLVHLETARLPGGVVLRAAIRRSEDGSLFSQVSSTGQVRRDPYLEQKIDALEARVRSAVGLDG